MQRRAFSLFSTQPIQIFYSFFCSYWLFLVVYNVMLDWSYDFTVVFVWPPEPLLFEHIFFSFREAKVMISRCVSSKSMRSHFRFDWSKSSSYHVRNGCSMHILTLLLSNDTKRMELIHWPCYVFTYACREIFQEISNIILLRGWAGQRLNVLVLPLHFDCQRHNS